MILMYRRILCLLLFVFFVAGCTYRGPIRRGIYTSSSLSNRLDASVLVVTDRNLPEEILISEPGNDTQLFVLQTKDGVAVAVTDALGTLFERADAGSVTLQERYDFIAQITLASTLTSTSCEDDILPQQTPGLCTFISISISPVGQEDEAITASAKRWKAFRTPGIASSVKWLDKHTRILFPILAPIYVQAQGNTLRNQFENSLKEALENITTDFAKHRETFKRLLLQKQNAQNGLNYVE